MNQAFDPYLKWLGIPPRQQPPHHYRLLAIEAFEPDPDVIANAADARMAHLKTFATGRHSALSQRLLNEVSAARVCLLNPQQKARYDAALRAQLEASATTAVAKRLPTTGPPPPPDELVVYPTKASEGASPGPVVRSSYGPSRPRTGAWPRDDRQGDQSERKELSQLQVGAILAAVIAILAVAWLCYSYVQKSTTPPRQVARKAAVQEERPEEAPPQQPDASVTLPRPAGKALVLPAPGTLTAGSLDSNAPQLHVNEPPKTIPQPPSGKLVPASPSGSPPKSTPVASAGSPAPAGQLQPPPARPLSYALKFDGTSSYVLVRKLGSKGSAPIGRPPITVEAIVQLWPGPAVASTRQTICGNGGDHQGFHIDREGDRWSFVFYEKNLTAPSPRTQGQSSNPTGKWVHVAGVFEARQLSLYVNGKPEADRRVTGTPIAGFDAFLIGAAHKEGLKSLVRNNAVATQYHFAGLMREVRISNKVRYGARFMPPKELTLDGNTHLLLRFTQGSGSQVSDSSPNKYLAEIHGAQWVNVDAEP